MGFNINVLKNLGAGAWGKLSSTLFRLIQVPLFLSFLGAEDYGRWLVLYSLPSWLTLANLGIGSVASNDVSMAVAANEKEKAKAVYATTFALILIICICGIALSILIAPFVPWERILDGEGDKRSEYAVAVIALAAAVFISFFGELFNCRFRAVHKTHTSIILGSFKPWIELLFMFTTLNLTTRFDYLAMSMLLSMVVVLVITNWLSTRVAPQLVFAAGFVKRENLKPLLRKGFAFQAFPLGNALLFQGSILVVQAVLGPVAVALFGTARTLVRTISQCMELVNHSIWPELSHLFGTDNKQKASKLHQSGVALSVSVAFAGVLVLALIGPYLYSFWVGKDLQLSYQLLLIFLLPIPFNAFWLTSSVVHMASNQHEGLAKRYLMASALSLIFCYLLSMVLGMGGAAISTIVADILLIPYVLKHSLKLTSDNWSNFLNGMINEVRRAPGILMRVGRN